MLIYIFMKEIFALLDGINRLAVCLSMRQSLNSIDIIIGDIQFTSGIVDFSDAGWPL